MPPLPTDPDPARAGVARFLEGRVPPGLRVVAPEGLAPLLGALSAPDPLVTPDWAVVEMRAEPPPAALLHRLLTETTPVFANDGYVVFARRPTFGLADMRNTPPVRALAERAAAGAAGPVTLPPAPAAPPEAPRAPLPSPPATPPVAPDVPRASAPPEILAFPPVSPIDTARPAGPPGFAAPLPMPPAAPAMPPGWPFATEAAAPPTPAPLPSVPIPAPLPAAPTAPPPPAPIPSPDTSPAPPAPAGEWGTLPARVAALLGDAAGRRLAARGAAAPGGALALAAAALPPSALLSDAALPLPDAAFDLALLLPEPGAPAGDAAAAARLLRPGGLALLVAENADSLGRRLAAALGRGADNTGTTAAALRGAAHAAGLAPLRLEGHGLDPWRATADAPPPGLSADAPAAALLEEAGEDAGPRHAAWLLLLARKT